MHPLGICSYGRGVLPQAHPLLARAAYAVYWGDNHKLIYAARVHNIVQNAQRAETLALLHLVSTAERPTHVYIDNQAVVDGFALLLASNPPPPHQGSAGRPLAPHSPCGAGQA